MNDFIYTFTAIFKFDLLFGLFFLPLCLTFALYLAYSPYGTEFATLKTSLTDNSALFPQTLFYVFFALFCCYRCIFFFCFGILYIVTAYFKFYMLVFYLT